jgi:hypothetical protein
VQQYGPGMDETQDLGLRALRELFDDPERNDWDEVLAANRALIKAIETGEPMTRRTRASLPNIFARPDGGNARSARPRSRALTWNLRAGSSQNPGIVKL